MTEFGPRLSLGAGTAERPLLGGDAATPPMTPTRSSLRGPHRLWMRRWMRPMFLVLIPPLLLLAYSFIHPHYPSLPPLPKIKIESGTSTGGYSNTGPEKVTYISPSSCLCGQTERGKQLCDVYHKQGLMASRLVEGSGARTRRLLTRAREAHPIKIGVLGGSGE